MLSDVQIGNGTPHDKYNMRGIAHARTNRKDDVFMQRQLVQSFTYIHSKKNLLINPYELKDAPLFRSYLWINQYRIIPIWEKDYSTDP